MEAPRGRAADGQSGEGIFAVLDGEIGDALRFVERVRNMIVHPGAYIREPVRPGTSNNENMSRTYELIDGIIVLVFDHLGAQMQTRHELALSQVRRRRHAAPGTPSPPSEMGAHAVISPPGQAGPYTECPTEEMTSHALRPG